jgi:hypothetical protein
MILAAVQSTLNITDDVVLCMQVGSCVLPVNLVTLVKHELLQCFEASEVD